MSAVEIEGARGVHRRATIGELGRLGPRRFPDREALVFGSSRLTYRQMEQQTSRLIQVLLERGLKPGDGIAVLSGNRIEVILTFLAAMAIGLRYTPLHPLGGEDDHALILGDAEVRALIADGIQFADRARALVRRCSQVEFIFSIGHSDFGIDLTSAMATKEEGPIEVTARADDVCILAYTGGTTGRPKGVMLGHQSLTAMIMAELSEWEWPAELRFLAATPISHAAMTFLMPTHLRGGTFMMLPHFDPDNFLLTVQQERATMVFLVPTMIYALLDHPRLRDYDLSSLQTCIYGAAPISPARLEQAIETFGPIFCQSYGQTEAPMCLTYLRKTDHDRSRPERLLSCGSPLAGVRLRILADDGTEAPVGEVGEICVQGPLLMDGYWRRPEETAAAFDGGWLHTGDLARRDSQGYLTILDRKKDMIVSGGFNIYPREIEDVLAQHEAVRMAAVIGVPDPRWGESARAFVVLKGCTVVAPEELIEFVRRRKGAMFAPKFLQIVDALPLSPLGKVDKKVLRAAFWNCSARQVS